MYRVLIVEDERLIRKGLVHSFPFEKADCIVIDEASNGEEGIRKIREHSPDIVITDIEMPIKNGFQMVEETLNIPYSVIILSGFDEFQNAKKAIQLGVSEFIVKPIDEMELLDAIKRACKHSKEKEWIQHLIQSGESKKELNLIPNLSSKKDQIVEKMFEFVHDHYHRKFIFQEVSDTIGYSPALLHKRFKQYTGLTFNDYLNRYRIQISLQMIQEKEKSIGEIAERCGFSDYKYYHTVFKNYIGQSPTKFLNDLEIEDILQS